MTRGSGVEVACSTTTTTSSGVSVNWTTGGTSTTTSAGAALGRPAGVRDGKTPKTGGKPAGADVRQRGDLQRRARGGQRCEPKRQLHAARLDGKVSRNVVPLPGWLS